MLNYRKFLKTDWFFVFQTEKIIIVNKIRAINVKFYFVNFSHWTKDFLWSNFISIPNNFRRSSLSVTFNHRPFTRQPISMKATKILLDTVIPRTMRLWLHQQQRRRQPIFWYDCFFATTNFWYFIFASKNKT